MSSQGDMPSAVDAWHRLWTVGANGETIGKLHGTRKKTKKKNSRTLLPMATNHPTNQTVQRDLHGNNMELDDNEEYGDILKRKADQVLRIMLHNINRLPISSRSSKSRQLVSYIAHTQVEFALLTEIGINWKKIHNNDMWFERVRQSFQSTRSILAHNTRELNMTNTVQFGGVCTMVLDDITHRVVAQGEDKSALGRWAWLRMEGRQGHHLRVVSAYRPVKSIGPGTVYSQHERYFQSQSIRHGDPRQIFYRDLLEEVNTWKQQGDHIIIGMDANKDI
jgi:hypothetical protein